MNKSPSGKSGAVQSFLRTQQGWLSGLSAPSAQAVLLSILAVAIVAPHAARHRTFRAYVGWAIAAASVAVAGHARAEPWPLMPLTILHAAAALFWVGGLIPLTSAVLAAQGADRAIPLRRFSKPALPLVGLLIATGVALILHRVEATKLLGTPWANLLSVKLTLVAVMLALATLHRFRTTDRIARDQTAASASSLKTETVLGLLVLALAMGFRLTPPPAAAPAHLPMTHFQRGSMMVMLEPSAIPPGLVSFTLQVIDGNRRDFVPKEVTISLSDPAAGIGPIKVQAVADGKEWTTPELTLPTEGTWQVAVTVRVSDFEAVRMESSLNRPN
jgi:copper transport protein